VDEIWAILEQTQGELDDIYHEIVEAGRRLAATESQRLCAVTLGSQLLPGSDQGNWLNINNKVRRMDLFLPLNRCFWAGKCCFKDETSCREQTGITFPAMCGTLPIGVIKRKSLGSRRRA